MHANGRLSSKCGPSSGHARTRIRTVLLVTCLLRIRGSRLDPDSCAELFSIEPHFVWKQGDSWYTRFRPNRTSGIEFEVSTRDGDFVPLQIQDALTFMRDHCAALRAATSRPDVEEAFLLFSWHIPLRAIAQFNRIPPELCALCGSNGVGIEFKVYLHASDPDAISGEFH